jgi:hypothetical protein
MDSYPDAGAALSMDGEQATEVNTAESFDGYEGFEPEVAASDEAPTAEPSYFDWDAYASHVAKVTVDGEELEVPLTELRNGYQRQADYTRKTQALSTQAKQYADAISVYEALQADPQGFLSSLSQALGGSTPSGPASSDDEFLDPTEKEIRELKAQLDTLQRFERQRIFDSEVNKLTEKYGSDIDVQSVVTHFANHGFPTLEAAYKDLAYDQELERLKALEDKARKDAEALEKKRKAAAVTSGGSKANGAVSTDPTQVRGIRAQFEMAKKQLGVD